MGRRKSRYIAKNKLKQNTLTANSSGDVSKVEEYKTKATTTQISASSRMSVKLGESYFTFEYTEVRTIPTTQNSVNTESNVNTVDMDKERATLWDTCNNQVDTQVSLAIEYMNKKK